MALKSPQPGAQLEAFLPFFLPQLVLISAAFVTYRGDGELERWGHRHTELLPRGGFGIAFPEASCFIGVCVRPAPPDEATVGWVQRKTFDIPKKWGFGAGGACSDQEGFYRADRNTLSASRRETPWDNVGAVALTPTCWGAPVGLLLPQNLPDALQQEVGACGRG